MRIRLFIFEDHWMCREALVSVLGKRDEIEIVGTAENPDEGIKEAVKIKPDIILMDIRFQNENRGIEATSTLLRELPETKVIIFTEFHDEENLRKAINAGASGFLLKKEVKDPDAIFNAIQAVYYGDAYITPSITAKVLKEIKRLSGKNKIELTKRELEVLNIMAFGQDNRGIAKELNIDIRTVANHVSNILFKMTAKNRTEAVAIARKEGMIE